jgi:hypothetical protein
LAGDLRIRAKDQLCDDFPAWKARIIGETDGRRPMGKRIAIVGTAAMGGNTGFSAARLCCSRVFSAAA